MLVSHSKRFIYIKTLKTAGTSVEIYFERYCVPLEDWFESHDRPESFTSYGIAGSRGFGALASDKWHSHMPAEVIAEILPEAFESYLKFFCIRNPFDKVVSAFWMRVERNTREYLRTAEFDLVRSYFKEWLFGGGDIMNDERIWMVNGISCADALIRYERIEADIAVVCEKINVTDQFPKLGSYKSDRRARLEDFREYYDAESENFVQKYYKNYFAAFDYSWKI